MRDEQTLGEGEKEMLGHLQRMCAMPCSSASLNMEEWQSAENSNSFILGDTCVAEQDFCYSQNEVQICCEACNQWLSNLSTEEEYSTHRE